MAKAKASPQSVSKTQVKKSSDKPATGFMSNFNFDSPKANYIFLGLIILAILLFFKDGVFGGKIFASPDNLSPNSYKTFLSDAKQQGIFPLWNPYIFMGMPSLGSLTAALPAIHNIFSFIWDSVLTGISGDNLFVLTIPYYLLFAISLYLYAQYKFKSNLIALIMALSGVFATGIIQLIIVGHHTKMMTFAFFPLIMLIIDKIIESDNKDKFRTVLNLALLAILVFIQLHFHHIQMLFYSYMMIGIYIGYIFIYRLIKKSEVAGIIKAVAVFIVATIIALAMDADIILSIKEYNKYSIRGESSIEQKSDPANNSDKPLSYDYATSWSFSPGEVLTFIMPYYYGFGTVDVNGKRDNMYWGQMPFTDSPVYFGVIILMLSIVGVVFNQEKSVCTGTYYYYNTIFVYFIWEKLVYNL